MSEMARFWLLQGFKQRVDGILFAYRIYIHFFSSRIVVSVDNKGHQVYSRLEMIEVGHQ